MPVTSGLVHTCDPFLWIASPCVRLICVKWNGMDLSVRFRSLPQCVSITIYFGAASDVSVRFREMQLVGGREEGRVCWCRCGRGWGAGLLIELRVFGAACGLTVVRPIYLSGRLLRASEVRTLITVNL